MVKKQIAIVLFILLVSNFSSCSYFWEYYILNKTTNNITIIYTLHPVEKGPFVFTLDSRIGDLDNNNHHNFLINRNNKIIVDASSMKVTATLKPNQGLILDYYGGKEDLDDLDYKRSLFSNLKELIIISKNDTILKCSNKIVPGFFQHRDDDHYVSMVIE